MYFDQQHNPTIKLKKGFGLGGVFEHALSFFNIESEKRSVYSPQFLEKSDEFYMYQALKIAMNRGGISKPNPSVGCLVLGKNDVVLATGTTHEWGFEHAETDAFSKISTKDLEGATVYLTLEPCTHSGRQPPCVDLFKYKKIARVVLGSLDPNPVVNGQGVRCLEELGIQVTVGVLEQECMAWNAAFFHEKLNSEPFIALKWAQSLDGCLAHDSGYSKWISSQTSRYYTHWLRHKYDAIVVGSGTVLADYPILNVRDLNLLKQHVPLKIIVDPSGKILSCQEDQLDCLMRTTFDKNSSTVVLTSKFLLKDSSSHVSARVAKLQQNSNLFFLSADFSGHNFSFLFQNFLKDETISKILGRPIQSIFVEGGPKLLSLFIRENLFHAAHVFVAPFFIGGTSHRITPQEKKIHTGKLYDSNSENWRLIASECFESDTLLEFVNINRSKK